MRNRLGAEVNDAPADGGIYGRQDSQWVPVEGEGSGGVESVNGQTGEVVLGAEDIGAGSTGAAVFAADSGSEARAAMDLGSASQADSGDFATAAQGAAADTAVQPGDLPTFGTAASADVNDFLAAPDGAVPAYSVDPDDLAAALVRAGLMQSDD